MKSGSSSTTDLEFDAELRKLLEEYLPRLQTLGAELLGALDMLDDAEMRLRARKLSHRIHGTAGSYGLAETAEAAGEIEDALLAADDAAVHKAGARFRAALAAL